MDSYPDVARVLLVLLTLPLRSSLPLHSSRPNYHLPRNFRRSDLFASQDWSVRLPIRTTLYPQYPPHLETSFEREEAYDSQGSEELAPWEQLDVVVLIRRRNERKRRRKKQRVITSKPIYIRRILRPNGSPFKGRTPTTEGPVDLHTLAGPPYHHKILPDGTPSVVEDEIPPNLQVLRRGPAASSSANLRATIAEGEDVAERKEKDFTDPAVIPLHSVRRGSPKTQIEGKIPPEEESKPNKFTRNPAYTFELEDAVSRKYSPQHGHSLSSSLFAKRHYQDDQPPQKTHFSATLGYPGNSWLRINKKDLL